MSSTSNIQTLLTNVVRPVYVYDPATSNYVAKVVVSNVDTFSVRTIEVENLEFGDARSNIYVGIDAGSTNPNSGSNVGVGIGAMENNINTKNTVAVGYRAGGANMTDVSATVAIGGSTLAGGSSNVYVGYGTGSAASNATGNVFLGAGIAPGTVSNQVRIGTDSNIAFFADMNTHRAGIFTSSPGYGLDVSASTTNLSGELQVGGTITAGGLNLATLRLPGPDTTLDASQISALELGQGDSALATQGYSGLSLQYYGGGFRHILRSRHNGVANSTGNAVDVFVNNSTSSVGSGGPGTGNKLALAITGGGLGVNGVLLPTAALDVSGSTKTANLIVPGYLRDGDAPSTFDISGGNISNAGTTRSFNFIGGSTTSNTIGGVTLSNSNVTVTGLTTTSNTIVSGYLRNALAPTQFDISGGNISNSGVHTTTGLVGTYLRDALAPTLFDLSGGNLMLSNRIRVGNGTVSVPSMVFSNDASAGFYSPATDQIGFATGGVQRMILSNSNIGVGLSNPLYTVDVSGIVRASGFIGTSGSGSSGGVSFSNGAVGLADGSVSVPTLTFQNDLSLGLYRPASNVLGFVSAGSNRMTLSNANLGIGTTAPAYTLDVSGTTQSCNAIVTGYLRNPTQFDLSSGTLFLSNRILTGAGTVSAPAYTFSADASMGLYDPATNVLGMVTAGAERMRVTAAGNVGIGTTAPAYTLDVSGTTQSCNAIVSGYIRNALAPTQFDISGGNISNSGTATTYTAITRNLYAPSTSDISLISYINMGTGENGGAGGPSNLQFLWLRSGGTSLRYAGINFGAYNTNSFLTYSTTGALITKYVAGLPTNQAQLDACQNLLTLTTTGRLGIFTNSPATTLDVSGAVRVLRDGSSSLTSYGLNNGTDTLILQHTGAYTTTADLGKSASILFANSTSNYPQARIVSEMTSVTPSTFGANLIFQTNNAGTTLAERMRIDSNGRVGIATNAPAFTLDVSGTTSSRLLRVPGLNTSTLDASQISAVELGQGDSATGAAGFSTISFQWNGGGSGFRHLLRTRHQNASNSTGNAIDLFLNNSTNQFGSGGPGSGNVLGLSVTAGGVGIGTTSPAAFLDVSATNGTGIRVGNGSALFDVVVSSTNYANVSMNGYFIVYKPGTTDKAPSNAIAQIGEPGAGHYFLSNNVGIRTTTPLGSLDVASGSVVVNRIGNVTANTDVSMIVEGSSNVGMYLQKGTNNNFGGLSFKTASNATLSERMRIDANTGNIGIATTAPAHTLDISAGNTTNTMRITAQQVPQILLQGNANDASYGALVFDARAASTRLIMRADGGVPLTFETPKDSERMRISTAGNVGIGTTAPTDLLHVAGALRLTGNPTPTTDGTSALFWNQSGVGPTIAGANIQFRTSNGSNVAMTINSSSRVGIATTAPAYRLDVSEGPTVASINMSTWTRQPVSNILIARGVVGWVNNAINWSNTALNTIDSNLMTVVLSNATTGCSFKVLKSGIWTFSVQGWMTPNSSQWVWLDVSTSDVASNAIFSNSSFVITAGQGAGTVTNFSWTGYLPSNTNYIYKIRSSASPVTSTTNNSNAFSHLQIAFLNETPASASTFPF